MAINSATTSPPVTAVQPLANQPEPTQTAASEQGCVSDTVGQIGTNLGASGGSEEPFGGNRIKTEEEEA